MNAAFGAPSAETLPFDLRHLRWPITYSLCENSNSSEKEAQTEKLTAMLVEALRLVLSQRALLQKPITSFVPQKPTKNPAIFHTDLDDLIPEARWGQKSGSFVVPDGGIAYLRLYPTEAVLPFETELEAEEALRLSGLRPLGRVSGWSPIRNVFGAAVYEGPQDGKLYRFTQLFLSREIWSVDACVLNAEYLRHQHESIGVTYPGTCISSGYIETYFVEALENMLSAAASHLGVRFPLKIEAGLVGIKGYSIATNEGNFRGKALRDVVEWDAEILSTADACEILGPFFDRIWAICGVKRTAARQAELVKEFDHRP